MNSNTNMMSWLCVQSGACNSRLIHAWSKLQVKADQENWWWKLHNYQPHLNETKVLFLWALLWSQRAKITSAVSTYISESLTSKYSTSRNAQRGQQSEQRMVELPGWYAASMLSSNIKIHIQRAVQVLLTMCSSQVSDFESWAWPSHAHYNTES